MERITIDKEFYESAVDRVEHFFIYGVLPEIFVKWYTRKHVADKDGIVQPPSKIEPSQEEEYEEDPMKSWCYCGEPCYGQMIMCETAVFNGFILTVYVYDVHLRIKLMVLPIMSEAT